MNPLVVHVVHRLAVGGLEVQLVSLINHLPRDKYRHAIVCLTEATEFTERLERDDVEIISLHKSEGKDISIYWKLLKTFRRLKPAIVHTYNIATLEAAFVARLTGVGACIHAEHGRDTYDLDGSNLKYIRLRRFLAPFINHWVAVSKDLEEWLLNTVAVPKSKVLLIYNGVAGETNEKDAFTRNSLIKTTGFSDLASPDAFLIGTVGRAHPVKDQITLLKAFHKLIEKRLAENRPDLPLFLCIVGDGPCLTELRTYVSSHGLEQQVWLPGQRDDVAKLMACMDLFVLPSLVEGVSLTILEAMSQSLPVIATDVGGNPELVLPEVNGALIPVGAVDVLSKTLGKYVDDSTMGELQGKAGKQRVQELFAFDKMLAVYEALYDRKLD